MLRKAATILAGLAIIAPIRVLLHKQFDGLDDTIEVCQKLTACKIPFSDQSAHEARKMARLVHPDSRSAPSDLLCDSESVNELVKLTKGLTYHPLAHFVCYLNISPDNFVNFVTGLALLALKGLQLLISLKRAANEDRGRPNARASASDHGAEDGSEHLGGPHDLPHEAAGHDDTAPRRRHVQVGNAPFGMSALLLFAAVGLCDLTAEVQSQSTAVAVRHDKVLVPAALAGKHSEYSSGIPPCTRSCKPVPMVCVDEGWFSAVQYVYWEQDGYCEHIKTNIPAGVTKMAADNVLWAVVGTAVMNAANGISIDDVAGIFLAYQFSDIQKEKIVEADRLRKLASIQARLALST
jgi:hypothetical protein